MGEHDASCLTRMCLAGLAATREAAVGYEPTSQKRLEPNSSSLDHFHKLHCNNYSYPLSGEQSRHEGHPDVHHGGPLLIDNTGSTEMAWLLLQVQ